MKKVISHLTAIILLSIVCNTFAGQYPKVILRGDYPDPTIIRDGEDYYMTNSPFVYSPGFLIWHSTDLINWRPLTRTMTAIKGSAYAPDLVKFNDKYYIYYPSAGTNWVIWSDNIMGPWSNPVNLKVGHIDPGHVLGEDGKRYLYLSGGMMVELSDDGLSTVGEPFKVYDGWRYPREWITECFCLESPKLTYKGGYYYLISAEGGTAGPPTSHMVVSARSKSVKGPWENSPYNPIVHTYSADEQWWSKGHGTLIDDNDGNWWIVYHAYEKAAITLGRQTLIDPIEWTPDGWFRLDKKRKPLQANPDVSGMELSDDFSSKKLGLQWTTWGKYNKSDIELKDGNLWLNGKGTSPGDGRLLLITAADRNYQVQVEVNIEKEGTGGLVLFYRENVFAGITADKEKFTVYKNANEKQSIDNTFGQHFFLKIINQKDLCTIQVSRDGLQWKTVSNFLDVSGMHHNNYKGFYALRAGLAAIGDAKVRFDNFQYTAGVLAPKPLFRDPVYDGAADPVVIWNPIEKKWWMFYTNRRATETSLPGVSWVFKTPIGIAQSADGANWKYVGTANFPVFPAELGGDDATLWAPDVVRGDDGIWHMYLSIQAGIAQRWGKVPGYIAHLTSNNLRDWKYVKRFDLPVGSYDADVIKMPDGIWRMYYKDPTNHASTFYYLESRNLKDWSEPKRVMSQQGEGPIVFKWKSYYWMILCDGRGFKTFRSSDANQWERQPGGALMPYGTGTGKDDFTAARHGEVVISNGRAYLFYFTHPGRIGEDRNKDTYEQRRSSIQVVELQLRDGWIVADRNTPTYVELSPPLQSRTQAISKKNKSASRQKSKTIMTSEKDMAAYLLVYFKDDTHSLYMALSSDGYSFTDINKGQPIINGQKIAEQKGVRDPYIMRGPDNVFYMAMTDLHIYAKRRGFRETEWMRPREKYGWGNNRALVLMKSTDLINWTHTNLRVDKAFSCLNDIGCAWAPEMIYDQKKCRIMLYYTMRFGNGRNKLYYTYMNDDLTKMETFPELLFKYPTDRSCIDGDIIQVGDKFHLFYVPHDGTAGVKHAASDTINSGYVYEAAYCDSEPKSCEAPNVWKRIGQDKWVLMYDIYGIKPPNFGFSETSDFKNFTDLGRFNEGVMKATNFSSPKHGAIIQLTKEEAERLANHWGLEKY